MVYHRNLTSTSARPDRTKTSSTRSSGGSPGCLSRTCYRGWCHQEERNHWELSWTKLTRPWRHITSESHVMLFRLMPNAFLIITRSTWHHWPGTDLELLLKKAFSCDPVSLFHYSTANTSDKMPINRLRRRLPSPYDPELCCVLCGLVVPMSTEDPDVTHEREDWKAMAEKVRRRKRRRYLESKSLIVPAIDFENVEFRKNPPQWLCFYRTS